MSMIEDTSSRPRDPPNMKRRLLRWPGVVAAFIALEVASGYFKTWGGSLRTSGTDKEVLVLLGTGLFYLGAWLRQLFWPAVFGALAYWLALRAARKDIATVRLSREDANVIRTINAQLDQARTSIAESYKEDVASLRKEVASALTAADAKVDGALASLRKEHAEELEKLRKQTGKAFAKLTGAVYHVQGAWLANTGHFAEAVPSLLNAAIGQAVAGDEANLGRVLSLLSDTCFPQATKQQIENSTEDVSNLMKALEKTLDPLNVNGRYNDRLRKLRLELKAAQSRA